MSNLHKPTKSYLAGQKEYIDSLSKEIDREDVWIEKRAAKNLPEIIPRKAEEQPKEVSMSAKRRGKIQLKEQLKKKFPQTTRVILRILDGRRLLGTNILSGKSNPVAFVWCGYSDVSQPEWEDFQDEESRILLTKTCKNTNDPIWNEDMIFPIEVYDIETITTLRCIILIRDEDKMVADDPIYTDLGQVEISVLEVIQQGKPLQNTIVESSKRYDLQKAAGMRKVDGYIRVSTSISFGTEDTEPLFDLFRGVNSIEGFTIQLHKSLKLGDNSDAESPSVAFGARVKSSKRASASAGSRRAPEKSVVEIMSEIITQSLSMDQFDEDDEIVVPSPRYLEQNEDAEQPDNEFGLVDEEIDLETPAENIKVSNMLLPQSMQSLPPPSSSSTSNPISRKITPRKWSALSACCTMVFLFCIMGILLAGPLSSYSVFSTVYLVRPMNCSGVVPVNESAWFENDWYLIPNAGACPTENRRAFYISSKGRLQSKIKYDECLSFSSSVKWEAIDSDNSLKGYDSNLAGGAAVWHQSYLYIIIATVLLYSVYPVVALGVQFRKSTGKAALLIIPLVIPTGIALWALALVAIDGTDQLDPLAWSTSFFSDCLSVEVESSTGYQLGFSALFLSGSFALLFYVLLFIYSCVAFTRENPFHPDNALDDDTVDDKLPSDDAAVHRAANGKDALFSRQPDKRAYPVATVATASKPKTLQHFHDTLLTHGVRSLVDNPTTSSSKGRRSSASNRSDQRRVFVDVEVSENEPLLSRRGY